MMRHSAQLVLTANVAGDVIWACVGLMAVVIAAAIGLLFLRKRFGPGSLSPEREKFSIEMLDDMHQKGMISDEEFKAMRRGLLGLGEPESKKVDQDDAEPATMTDSLETETPDSSTPESDHEQRQ